MISDNVEAARILVRAGAELTGAITLAQEKNMKNILNVLTNGNKDAAGSSVSASIVMNQAASLTVSEEKEVLLKRLAELEEKEKGDLEEQIKEKKHQLDKLKTTFKTEKDKTRKEIDSLETKLVTLKDKLENLATEEETKIKALQTEINTLVHDVDKKKIKELKENEVGSCFECPVCLDICKPPAEVVYIYYIPLNLSYLLLCDILDLAVS